MQHTFEWFSVYSAVDPSTGRCFFLELLYLNAENFQLSVNIFTRAFSDKLNLLLLDSSGAHTALQLALPEDVRLVFQALYSSELHPSARVWCDLKDARAWQQFTDPYAQETYVGDLLLENMLR